MDKYVAVWHIPWLIGTPIGTNPKSIMRNIPALKLHFKDTAARDETYVVKEKFKYNRCICNMVTQIQMLNDEVQVTRAAIQKLILDRLPHQMLEQMNTINLSGKTYNAIINIVTNARRTAE